MRKFFKLSIFLFIIYSYCTPKIFCTFIESSAITYDNNGGRLGDSLLNYSQTKWVAYKNNIPFFYTPFQYSNMLKICELEKIYNPCIDKKFKKSFKIPDHKIFNIDKKDSCLYKNSCYADIDVNWTDKNFINSLKKTNLN